MPRSPMKTTRAAAHSENENEASQGGPSSSNQANIIHSQPRRDKGKCPEASRNDSDRDEVEEEVDSSENKNQEEVYVHHHEIFDRLMALASDHGNNHYVNEDPAHGQHPRDVTAYRASQRTWARELAHRPETLFLWEEPVSSNELTEDVGRMRFNGQTVLDYRGQPIRAFDIPWTVSSEVEGYRVEAWMRADRRMHMADIVARMYTEVQGGERVPRFSERTLATKAKRFRGQHGLVSWGKQHAKMKAVAFFENLRSDAQKCHNLAVQRDLTAAERSIFQLITMERDANRKSANAIAQAKREKCIRRHRRNAGKDYPKGEFLPGARDGGDFLDGLVGGSGDETEGAEDVSPGSNAAAPSISASHSTAISKSGQTTDIIVASPLRADARVLSVDEEVTQWDNGVNASSRQHKLFTDSAVAPDADQQATEAYDSVSELSLDSDLEDPADSRNDEPTTAEEAQMLQSALALTIVDFRELSGGSNPDQTNPADNYFSQWAALQAQFNLIWKELWSNDNAPMLWALDRWTGGISNWHTAALARSERTMADEEAWALYSQG